MGSSQIGGSSQIVGVKGSQRNGANINFQLGYGSLVITYIQLFYKIVAHHAVHVKIGGKARVKSSFSEVPDVRLPKRTVDELAETQDRQKSQP